MDETYVKVKGKWKYLYRAVDKAGQTVDFLLTAKRDRQSAARLLRKAVNNNGTPIKITAMKQGERKEKMPEVGALIDWHCDAFGQEPAVMLRSPSHRSHKQLRSRHPPLLLSGAPNNSASLARVRKTGLQWRAAWFLALGDRLLRGLCLVRRFSHRCGVRAFCFIEPATLQTGLRAIGRNTLALRRPELFFH
jgi:transposase-like protein